VHRSAPLRSESRGGLRLATASWEEDEKSRGGEQGNGAHAGPSVLVLAVAGDRHRRHEDTDLDTETLAFVPASDLWSGELVLMPERSS
jgi:hypothetical protein